MKSIEGNNRLIEMTKALEDLLNSAGFYVTCSYGEEDEQIYIRGDIEAEINTNMSSSKASLEDIFGQLKPIIRESY